MPCRVSNQDKHPDITGRGVLPKIRAKNARGICCKNRRPALKREGQDNSCKPRHGLYNLLIPYNALMAAF